MNIIKPPLPKINLKDVIPDSHSEKRCSPHLDFDNGSCIPLNILIEMAEAYNKYYENTNKELIKLNNNLDTLYPDEYKRYLLLEFKNKISDSQKDWINDKFIKLMSESTVDELQNNIFRPDGPQGKFEWLSTIDINQVLSQYESKYPDFVFLGAVPIDFEDLDYLPFKNLNLDELFSNNKKRFGLIFNLDEHYKSGSHWVSLFFDSEKSQIYFSDSYGTRPEKRIVSFMKNIENYFKNKNNKVDIKYNKTQHQRGNSECGVYSINFILRLLKGKTFDRITQKRLTDAQVNKCRLVYFNKLKE